MAQLVFELIECTKVSETFRRRLAEINQNVEIALLVRFSACDGSK